MNRNIEKTIEGLKMNDDYTITGSEMAQLMHEAQENKEALLEAIYKAFKYGYVLGGKAEKAQAKNKTKRVKMTVAEYKQYLKRGTNNA